MKYKRLGRTDLEVSLLGFGASPLGDVYDIVDPKEAKMAVHFAIDNGINFFDVSPYYGLTLAEQRLGEALAGRRKKAILATKCGRYGRSSFDFSAKRIATSLEESLLRLQTDYVDLLQAHDVEFGDFRQIVDETIPAMRKLQEQGKTRYIGVSGYPLDMLVRIIEMAPVDSVLTYCRHNLICTDMDDILTPVVKKLGIGLINASPLCMGVLTEHGAPDWHPAPLKVRQAGMEGAVAARKRGLDLPIIALRFCMEHPYVSSTLVGMSTWQQVRDNLKALQIPFDGRIPEEVKEILSPIINYTWNSGRPENQSDS